ncbi:hypothetical protein Tco_1044633 [Tanacetum coccineum]|uniref:Uncharacterized protein n=1 Tax=Tanacetum coccineum TaxID=301880 RepID=A0ABQ5GQG3_9ASTR
MDSEDKEKGTEKKSGGTRKKTLARKREVAQDDEESVNLEILSTKYPIVDWEYQLLGQVGGKDFEVYKLTRVDGSASYHGNIQAFLGILEREDLSTLYRLVQERFQLHPLEGRDLLLWGDLRMIFDPDEKYDIWMNQLDRKFLKWKLHEHYGIHTLFMDGTPMQINMLVEKKYPLIKDLLEKMLNLQLEAEEENDFVNMNESASEFVVEKPTVETNEPKTARKEDGALIIEDWVSESEEENVPKIKTVEMFNKPSFAKINFVKSTKQVKSPRNTSVDKNRQNTPSPRENKRN